MKKAFNRIISLAAALLLTLGCAVSAHAAGSYFLSEGFYYGVENKEAFVHGYEGEEQDVVIRERFLSCYVTAVDESAFYENATIRSLSLYDATRLCRIGRCAFGRCVNLAYVEIPDTIREMGESVFDGCSSLSYVCFREGAITDIPAQTFNDCTALETVIFENGATSLGSYAFANCASLQEITLPDTVTSIADNAFDGCEGLVICCHDGSYAMQYAIEHQIAYSPITDPVTFILGDADGDGRVTIVDATRVQRVLAAYPDNDKEGAILRGDCDRDGLNILDATKIQRWLAQYSVKEPIGTIFTVNS